MRDKSVCVFELCFCDLSYEMQSLSFSSAEVQTLFAIGATGAATSSPLAFELGFAYFLSQYLISSCLFVRFLYM